MRQNMIMSMGFICVLRGFSCVMVVLTTSCLSLDVGFPPVAAADLGVKVFPGLNSLAGPDPEPGEDSHGEDHDVLEHEDEKVGRCHLGLLIVWKSAGGMPLFLQHFIS